MRIMREITSTGLAIALAIGGLTIAQAGRVQAEAAAAVEKPAQSEYIVKAGDTLASIAMKLSGSENDWVLIARANGMGEVSKSQPLEAGKRLKIPEELRQS